MDNACMHVYAVIECVMMCKGACGVTCTTPTVRGSNMAWVRREARRHPYESVCTLGPQRLNRTSRHDVTVLAPDLNHIKSSRRHTRFRTINLWPYTTTNTSWSITLRKKNKIRCGWIWTGDECNWKTKCAVRLVNLFITGDCDYSAQNERNSH